MYIMCVCLFSALSHRVGSLQISIIIIIIIRSTVISHHSWQFSLKGSSCLIMWEIVQTWAQDWIA